MAKDLVCGMEVDEKGAVKIEHEGETYYFCSPNCMKKFEKNPNQYIKKEN